MNPNSGFIQNCNSSPFNTTMGIENPSELHFPEWLGIETVMTNRALRSLELFNQYKKITKNEMMKIKYDLKYSDKSNFAQVIKKTNEIKTNNQLLKNAISVLQKWNLETDVNNLQTAFGIYSLFEFIEQEPAQINIKELSSNILFNAKKFKKWHGTLEIPWGKVNRLIRGDLNLPLNGGPDINHAIYGKPQKDGILKAIAGDCYIIFAEWDNYGRVQSQSIHQYGSTQNKSSIHYNDQAELFSKQKMKPVYFNLYDIQNNLEREYQP